MTPATLLSPDRGNRPVTFRPGHEHLVLRAEHIDLVDAVDRQYSLVVDRAAQFDYNEALNVDASRLAGRILLGDALLVVTGPALDAK